MSRRPCVYVCVFTQQPFESASRAHRGQPGNAFNGPYRLYGGALWHASHNGACAKQRERNEHQTQLNSTLTQAIFFGLIANADASKAGSAMPKHITHTHTNTHNTTHNCEFRTITKRVIIAYSGGTVLANALHHHHFHHHQRGLTICFLV